MTTFENKKRKSASQQHQRSFKTHKKYYCYISTVLQFHTVQ